MGCPASLAANRRRDFIAGAVDAILAEVDAVDVEEQNLFGDARGDELPPDLGRHGEARLARLQECLAQLDQEAARARGEQTARDIKADVDAAAGRKRRGRKPRRVDPVAEAEREVVRARTQAERQRQHRAATEAAAAAQGRRPGGRMPDYDTKVRDAEAARDAARAAAAADPVPGPSAAPDAQDAQANMTDPQSRTMKTAKGWVQGYNAQAMVNENQIVVAARVTQDHGDVHLFDPMVAASVANLAAAGIEATIGLVLADAGYCSDANLRSDGPTRLIATRKRHKLDQLHRDQGPTSGPPPDGLSALDAMDHRLRTPEGRALYKRRSAIVEPVFGQIKTNRACERFMRRGLAAADSEWNLITACHNLLKVFTSGYQIA